MQQALKEELLDGGREGKVFSACLAEIVAGKANDAEIAAFLAATRMNKPKAEELAEAALALIPEPRYRGREQVLDTCGTGGDGAGTLNVSTAAALVAAAAGCKVAKHGNKGVSSASGSANVLEEMGVKTALSFEESLRVFEETGLGFFFAPVVYPQFRFVAAARKALGVRSVFNLLGPLMNPLNAGRRVLGCADYGEAELLATALREMKVKKAVVVCSMDGLDEVSVAAPTQVIEVTRKGLRRDLVSPEEFGMERKPLDAVKVASAKESAGKLLEVFAGKDSAAAGFVELNAGAALYVAGKAGSIGKGVGVARKVIGSGKVLEFLRGSRR